MRDLGELGERYANMLRNRASKPGAYRSAQTLVQSAQSALQYEIDTKQPYNIGGCCGRFPSYFQMLLASLCIQQNNKAVRRMTREDMLEVVESAAESLEWGSV